MTALERWLPVPEWEGYYSVSDHGRVRSETRQIVAADKKVHVRQGKYLRDWVTKDGYHIVALCRDNERAIKRVHALVLLAFVGPRPLGQEACHWDDDKSNNSVENLRWDTRSANTFDRIRNGGHWQASRTHCVNGHEFNADNTYQPPGRKQRQCRACKANRKRRSAELQKIVSAA